MNSGRGFTLIEMLIGMVLLGLMTLALFSALRISTQSWERAEEKSMQVVDLAVVEAVLRREIGSAFPLRVGLASENKIAFEGDERGLKFFAALPAHFSTGGLSMVELRHAATVSPQTGGTLWLRHSPQDGLQTEAPPDDAVQETRLLGGIDKVSFAYFGTESDLEEATWKSSWAQTGRLPRLVRLTVTLAGGAERELIIPLNVGEEAGCNHASLLRICVPRIRA